jgi:hypothetical protein
LQLHQSELLTASNILLPAGEVSDHRNDLLADYFDGRYLVIVRYADNQMLDAGIIDGSAVFYGLAYVV